MGKGRSNLCIHRIILKIKYDKIFIRSRSVSGTQRSAQFTIVPSLFTASTGVQLPNGRNCYNFFAVHSISSYTSVHTHISYTKFNRWLLLLSFANFRSFVGKVSDNRLSLRRRKQQLPHILPRFK